MAETATDVANEIIDITGRDDLSSATVLQLMNRAKLDAELEGSPFPFMQKAFIALLGGGTESPATPFSNWGNASIVLPANWIKVQVVFLISPALTDAEAEAVFVTANKAWRPSRQRASDSLYFPFIGADPATFLADITPTGLTECLVLWNGMAPTSIEIGDARFLENPPHADVSASAPFGAAFMPDLSSAPYNYIEDTLHAGGPVIEISNTTLTGFHYVLVSGYRTTPPYGVPNYEDFDARVAAVDAWTGPGKEVLVNGTLWKFYARSADEERASFYEGIYRRELMKFRRKMLRLGEGIGHGPSRMQPFGSVRAGGTSIQGIYAGLLGSAAVVSED